MVWPFSMRARWPRHLPRLYPQLDSRGLSTWLTAAEHARLRGVVRVRVLPLFSEQSRPEEVALGVGLARLLVRDLMLVRELSVRSPEDTPLVSQEEAQRNPREHLVEERLVTGQVRLRPGRYRVELELWSRTGVGEVRHVEGRTLEGLLQRVPAAVTEGLGGRVTAELQRGWQLGRPGHMASLVRLGELCLVRSPVSAVLALRSADPGFALPAHLLEEGSPEHVQHLLGARAADPYDAHLHFLLFCATWRGRGEQPEALQFIRRTLELSPGHGKAHMCAPHAASPQVDMLAHAELAYRLLPGNSFAISNYIHALLRTGRPEGQVERVLELAREIIALDPKSPEGYLQAIHILRRVERAAEALEYAERLQALYGPPMDPRTRYCLEQNPQVREALRSGKLDPVRDLAGLVERLRAQARRRAG